MELTSINSNPEFKAVSEPLGNVGREIRENQQRLAEIHNELLRLSADAADSKSAWSNYINPTPDALTKRSDLRSEAERVEARLQMLNSALREGNMQVDMMRGKLSRSPCARARPHVVSEIKKILRALDEIDRANSAIRAVQSTIEEAGYKVTLPPAVLSIEGYGAAYRSYIEHHYPEVK
jgi:chromosome segregation ATPase